MQYHDMNALQSHYADRFTILAFPCNQYWIQEPGASADEILNAIKYVRPGGGFTPNFQLFKKIDVSGENQHPLYSYLVKYCPPTRNFFAPVDRLIYKPLAQQDVRWNWEKFLVGTDGRVLKRYDGGTKPAEIEPDVRAALGLEPLTTLEAPADNAASEAESEAEFDAVSEAEFHPESFKQRNRPTEKFYPAYKGDRVMMTDGGETARPLGYGLLLCVLSIFYMI